MLTDAAVRRIKPREKAFKTQDMHGMYLLVQPGGGRYWRWDYRHAGERGTIALHDRTLGPLAEIIEAEQAVASGSSIPAGKLRISASIVLAHVLLPRLATGFVTAYPQVDLEIIAEDRKVDPVDDNYDLVIRIDPSPDERLVGGRILEDERVLVAPQRPNQRTSARRRPRATFSASPPFPHGCF